MHCNFFPLADELPNELHRSRNVGLLHGLRPSFRAIFRNDLNGLRLSSHRSFALRRGLLRPFLSRAFGFLPPRGLLPLFLSLAFRYSPRRRLRWLFLSLTLGISPVHGLQWSGSLCAVHPICNPQPFQFTICSAGADPVMRDAKPPAPQPRFGRSTLSIEGLWKVAAEYQESAAGADSAWSKAPPTEAVNLATDVVTALNAKSPRSVWIWREFSLPAAWSGQTVRLLFTLLPPRAHLWINGLELPEAPDASLASDFAITKLVRLGDRNLLAIRFTAPVMGADNKPNRGSAFQMPHGVSVVAHDEAYIADVMAQADGLGHLNANITFVNTSDKSGAAELEADIAPPSDSVGVRDVKSEQNLLLGPGLNLSGLIMTEPGKGLQTWSRDHPVLYTLNLSFKQDKDVLDTDHIQFGFREFGWMRGAITLNGISQSLVSSEPIFNHELGIDPLSIKSRAQSLVTEWKSAGTNLVYVCEPAPELLSAADVAGIFVIEGASKSLSAADAAIQLKSLVVRDRNHVSVLAWNLPEGSQDLGRSIRTQDPTRFLLVGSGAAARLWLPQQIEISSVAPPAGLLLKLTN